MIKIFYDLETTGLNPKKNGIHQIALAIEVDGEVVTQKNLRVRPKEGAVFDPEAVKMSGATEEELRDYPPMRRVYSKLIMLLGQYLDRYDKTSKAHLVGFNNRAFDDRFFRQWFEDNDDPYFGSWFWSDSLDSMVLASQYLLDRRKDMPSFKLSRVAKELGIEVEDDKLHDAFYDLEITRKVYRIVTGLDFEL